MFVYLQNFYPKVLTHTVVVFGDGSFQRSLVLDGVMKVVSLDATGVFIRKWGQSLLFFGHVRIQQESSHLKT